MTPGETIRTRRRARGLTQLALAAILGVRPQYVQHWESGRRNPGGRSAVRLARALGGKVGGSCGASMTGGACAIQFERIPPGASSGSHCAPFIATAFDRRSDGDSTSARIHAVLLQRDTQRQGRQTLFPKMASHQSRWGR